MSGMSGEAEEHPANRRAVDEKARQPNGPQRRRW